MDYNIGANNYPKIFLQAMSYKESNLWHDVLKDEMNFMAHNKLWDFVA